MELRETTEMPNASLPIPGENKEVIESNFINPWSEPVPKRDNYLEVGRIIVGLLLSFCLLINAVLLALGLLFSIVYAAMQELSTF